MSNDVIFVTLTNYEQRMAAEVGISRMLASINKNNAHGMKGIGWNEHIEGAGGEIAVAKFLGTYFSGSVGTFTKTPDLSFGPFGLEIRTSLKPDGKLVVRPAEADAKVYVAVNGTMREGYRLVGWCFGYEAKQEQWKADPGHRNSPAYFPPNEALCDMYNLKHYQDWDQDVVELDRLAAS